MVKQYIYFGSSVQLDRRFSPEKPQLQRYYSLTASQNENDRGYRAPSNLAKCSGASDSAKTGQILTMPNGFRYNTRSLVRHRSSHKPDVNKPNQLRHFSYTARNQRAAQQTTPEKFQGSADSGMIPWSAGGEQIQLAVVKLVFARLCNMKTTQR